MRVPAPAAAATRTRARSTREGFYVLSGTVRFTVGHDSHDAPAGTLVVVPPGAPHTFANVTDQPAVMLSTFTPARYAQYFRDLRDLLADGRPLTPEANATAMARYATRPATEFPATGLPATPRT